VKEITIIQKNRAERQEDLLSISVEGHSSVNFTHYHPYESLDVFVDGYIIGNELQDIHSEKNNHYLLIDKIIDIINSKKYEVLDKINGHYNIIICDKKKNEVVVITDRYGMRPLFWFRNANIVVISNSFSTTCRHEEFDDQINYGAVADFLKFEWVTNDETFFKNINRFSAGTISIINNGKLRIKQYFKWPSEIQRNNKSVDENAEQGFYLLRKAVDRVLEGVSFPGVTISGGLDTRIITGFLHKYCIQQPFLYHCYFSKNELAGAKGVAETYGINLTIEDRLRLSDGIEKIPIKYGDGCTSLNQFWLSKLYSRIEIMNNSNCIIDGFILDLLFNLYGFAIYEYKSKKYDEQSQLTEKDKRNLANQIYGLPEGYFLKYFNNSILKDINTIALDNVEKQCSTILCNDTVHFSRILYLMTRGKRYVYMMPSVNQRFCPIRFPGLDYDLIDYCMKLPIYQFKEPLVYLKIFEKHFPELNEVVWAKTGQPLKHGVIKPKRYNKYLTDINYILKRISFGKIDFKTSSNDYNRLFREDKLFRSSIINFFNDGQCLSNRIIGIEGLERLYNDIYYGRNNFFILERLLAIELFFRFFVLRTNNETDTRVLQQ
jgi:hypothetical protein